MDGFINIWNYKISIDTPINFDVCFLPGVKSKIIQDGEFTIISIKSKYWITRDLFYYDRVINNLESIDQNKVNNNSPVIYKIYHQNITNKNTLTTPYLITLDHNRPLAVILNFELGTHTTLLSVECNNDTNTCLVQIPLKNITKKQHNGVHYYIIDVQSALKCSAKGYYSFKLDFSYDIPYIEMTLYGLHGRAESTPKLI